MDLTVTSAEGGRVNLGDLNDAISDVKPMREVIEVKRALYSRAPEEMIGQHELELSTPLQLYNKSVNCSKTF